MRLRKKQINKKAVALAIAASVAVSVPATANAIAYDADGGKVTVEVDEDDGDSKGHTVSYQDKSSKYDHTKTGDNEVNVYDSETYKEKTSGENAEEKGNSNTSEVSSDNKNTDTIVEVKDNVKDQIKLDTNNDGTADDKDNGSTGNIKIKVDLNNNSDGSTAKEVASGDAISIGKNVENVDVTVEDTSIKTDAGDGVSVGENSKINMTLDDAKIEATGGAGISIEKGSEVDIELDGSSVIKGGKGFAGINVKEGATVKIHDDDDDDDKKESKQTAQLEATGGEGGAGIGGNSGESSGIIKILSGIIKAKGGDYAAGIGGGKNGDSGDITIGDESSTPENTQVTAEGGVYAAGIGGGDGSTNTFDSVTNEREKKGGDAGTITINGGTVIANGGGNKAADTINNIEKGGGGAGIGGGNKGNSTKIEITGGTVTATGTHGGAGIGGGVDGAGNNIKISGKSTEVTAQGGDTNSLKESSKMNNKYYTPNDTDGGGAGIGGGFGGSAANITIENGATVNATGGKGITGYDKAVVGGDSSFGSLNGKIDSSEANQNSFRGGGAGIGSGGANWQFSYTEKDTSNLTGEEKCYAEAAKYKFTGIQVTEATNINILSGAKVTATGGSKGGAGIGGGAGATASGITISGGANVYATGSSGAGESGEAASGGNRGNEGGAGIGGGSSIVVTENGKTAKRGGDGSVITIDNATVEAYGGKEAAGIGGGDFGDGYNILITNGAKVTMAQGGNSQNGGGAGIGGGYEAGGHGITISGGADVTALGGINAAGIGGGAGSSVVETIYKDANGNVLPSGVSTYVYNGKTYLKCPDITGGYLKDSSTNHYIYYNANMELYYYLNADSTKYIYLESYAEALAHANISYETKTVVTGGNGYGITITGDGTVVNATGGSGLVDVKGHNEIKRCFIIDENGKHYLQKSDDSYVSKWETDSTYLKNDKYVWRAGTDSGNIDLGLGNTGWDVRQIYGYFQARYYTDVDGSKKYLRDSDGNIICYLRVVKIKEGGGEGTFNYLYSYNETTGEIKAISDSNNNYISEEDYCGVDYERTAEYTTMGGGAGIGGGAYGSGGADGKDSAIIISDGANVTANGGLTLDSYTYKYEGKEYTGNGAASANGGGAGIGGGYMGDGTNINISGDKTVVVANGSTGGTTKNKPAESEDGGAGIGGGYKGNGTNINISGGNVDATGSTYGAGIGGGWNASGSGINISGGDVDANGTYGAGIGGGAYGNGNDITISGGTVDAASKIGGAGIGGGNGFYNGAKLNGDASNIVIRGGNVTAIGGTYKTYSIVTDTSTVYKDSNGNVLLKSDGSAIESVNDFVKKTSSDGKYEIIYYYDNNGTETKLNIADWEKYNIDAIRYYPSYGRYCVYTDSGWQYGKTLDEVLKYTSFTVGTIETSEDVVIGGGAGVGSGAYGDVTGNISVTGSTTDLKAYGGAGGAGIGTGDGSTAGTGDISIALDKGGKVLAIGGEAASGIGGGRNTNGTANHVASISIANKGKVRAFADGTKFAVDTTSGTDTSGSKGVLNGRFVDNTDDGDRDGTKEDGARGLSSIVDTKLGIYGFNGETVSKIADIILPVYNRSEDKNGYAALNNGFTDSERMYNSFALNLTDEEGSDKSAKRVYVFDATEEKLYQASVAGTDLYSPTTDSDSAKWTDNNGSSLNMGRHVGLETGNTAMFTADQMQFPRYNKTYSFKYYDKDGNEITDPTSLHGGSEVVAQLVKTEDKEQVYTLADLSNDVHSAWALKSIRGSYTVTDEDGNEIKYNYEWTYGDGWTPASTQSVLNTDNGNLEDKEFVAKWTYKESAETPENPDTPDPVDPNKPDNKPKKEDDDMPIIPVVPPVVPVTPETPVTPEVPVTPAPETPAAEPVAETPAAPAPAAPAAPATNKLPQTGAALFESIGLAAAGLALSLGSLFGKGKHERK